MADRDGFADAIERLGLADKLIDSAFEAVDQLKNVHKSGARAAELERLSNHLWQVGALIEVAHDYLETMERLLDERVEASTSRLIGGNAEEVHQPEEEGVAR